MNRWLTLLGRDLAMARRHTAETLTAVSFFVLAVILFPFAVGPDANLLARIAAAVIWVASLLASLLSMDRLFESDHQDGGLDLIALSALPLEAVVLAKVTAHWLATGLPVLTVSAWVLFSVLTKVTALSVVLSVVPAPRVTASL